MKKLASDVSYTGLSYFLAAVLQLLLQVYIVRHISPASFGEYISANATVAFAEILFLTRGGEVALQHIGKYWSVGNHKAAYSVSRQLKKFDWILNWTFYFIVTLFALFFSKFLRLNPAYIIALALTIPSQIGYGVYKSMFISTHRLKYQAIFEMSYTIIYVGLCIVLVYLFKVPGLIGAIVLMSLLKTLAARAITEKWWPEDARQNSENTITIGFKKGLGIQPALRNAFINGANQVDLLMLNAAIGPQHAAVYKVSKSVASLPSYVANPVWSALRPRILQAWHTGDRKRLWRLITIPSLLMVSAFIIVIVPLWYFSDELLVLLYGKEYSSAALPFLILVVGTWVFHGSVNSWFNFLVIIDEKKLTGTLTYGFLFVAILIGGFFYGGKSATHMAVVVSGAMLAVSLLCMGIFIKRIKKIDTYR